MFGTGVDIHVLHGAGPDGHAVNRVHVTLHMSASLYLSSLSVTCGSGLCVFLKCSEGEYDWVVQWSHSQGSPTKAPRCLKEPGCFVDSLSSPTPALHSPLSTLSGKHWNTSHYLMTVFCNINGEVIQQKLPLLQHHTDESQAITY